MSEPWLHIIGVGEDGLAGLTAASLDALKSAEIVFGARRHLDLLGVSGREYPLPFSVEPVLAEAGRRVVVLASGDPFWHGVGGTLAGHLPPEAWRVYPAPSTFSRAAAAMGWRLEEVICLGLHAAPLARLRPILNRGQRVICLLRDGAALGELTVYLTEQGFGASEVTALQALSGPREAKVSFTAQDHDKRPFSAPICAAVTVRGALGLPQTSGLDDALFVHDGQITKRPIRALTLSALAPRAHEVLWDIGTGSGSIAIEFLLAAPGSRAYGLEADATRAARARMNAEAFGLSHRFEVTEARAPEGLNDLPRPDVVFIGGGASEDLLGTLWPLIPEGTRLVANAVTLDTEALLYAWAGRVGGSLLRVDLAEAQPLGSKLGWQAARPIVQWSVVK